MKCSYKYYMDINIIGNICISIKNIILNLCININLNVYINVRNNAHLNICLNLHKNVLLNVHLNVYLSIHLYMLRLVITTSLCIFIKMVISMIVYLIYKC